MLLFVCGIVQIALNIAPIRGRADSYERPVREEYEYSASIVKDSSSNVTSNFPVKRNTIAITKISIGGETASGSVQISNIYLSQAEH